MGKIRKIIFVQLPLLNHDISYALGNIEYASGAIIGYILNQVTSDISLTILPRMVAQCGSDSTIVNQIIAGKPDVVAFTSFLWNIERNLVIARRIKEIDSKIIILFGGPEINFGSYAFSTKRDYVDYFVIGEGEWFFHQFLSGINIEKFQVFEKGNRIIIQPKDALISLEHIFEPFSGRVLEPTEDGSMFFELTRGCPYKCSYCLYSKNYQTLREVPFERLLQTLADKRLTEKLRDLYLLVPAFNATGKFNEKLLKMSRINHSIRLHSEMRGEGIDGKRAELIYKAGFRSMEVGIQTFNYDTLKRVGRKSSPGKELEGIQFLKSAGIDVKIGIIPGLPNDRREQFLDMIDLLVHSGLSEHIELYPLMILPGTVIRDAAIEGKINYIQKPPYYYNYGWGMSYDDIIEITQYTETKTGYSHMIRRMPDFISAPDGELIKGVYFGGDEIKNWDGNRYKNYINTNVFSFFINLINSEFLYNGLDCLLSNLPASELYNVIVYSDVIINEKKLYKINSLINDDHLMLRMNIFHEWIDRCRNKIYQVFADYDTYQRARETYSIVMPIYRLTDRNTAVISSIGADDNILFSKGSFRILKDIVVSLFSNTPESAAFEDESEQEEFYQSIGYEYAAIPYKFKIIRL